MSLGRYGYETSLHDPNSDIWECVHIEYLDEPEWWPVNDETDFEDWVLENNPDLIRIELVDSKTDEVLHTQTIEVLGSYPRWDEDEIPIWEAEEVQS